MSNESIDTNTVATYTVPADIKNNHFAYEGNWNVMEEYANPQKGAKLILNFESKEIYLVMRPKGDQSKVKVFIDDKIQNYGEDNIDGIVTVDSDRLYKLIRLFVPGRHILRLEFEDDNTELFAFTFG